MLALLPRPLIIFWPSFGRAGVKLCIALPFATSAAAAAIIVVIVVAVLVFVVMRQLLLPF